MTLRKTLVIANPNSGAGRLGKRWDRILAQIREHYGQAFDSVLTTRQGHATELSRDGASAGYDLIVAVGGDGTANEVLNGFDLTVGNQDGPALGLLPFGTGNDLAKSLGVPKEMPQAIELLRPRPPRPIDVGKITALDDSGGMVTRHFLNVADFGSGGAIAARANNTTKAFGARLTYIWSILSTMATFKNPEVTFNVDGEEDRVAVANNVVVANGRHFGSGLTPAPDALMDDGVFDVVLMGDFGLVEGALNLPRLMKGTHLSHPKVRSYRGSRIAARADRRVQIEADGELVGVLPATFEIVPEALMINA